MFSKKNIKQASHFFPFFVISRAKKTSQPFWKEFAPGGSGLQLLRGPSDDLQQYHTLWLQRAVRGAD